LSTENLFILTWNPKKSGARNAKEILDWEERIAVGKTVTTSWAVGNRKSGISKGDRILFLRQGEEPRGLLASGLVKKEIYEDKHWDDPKKMATYIDFEVIQALSLDNLLPVKRLLKEVSGVKWNSLQASGTSVSSSDVIDVVCSWDEWYERQSNSISLKDKSDPVGDDEEGLPEGATKKITVNSYERSPKNRQGCLDFHGYDCWACDMSFEGVYGERGKEFVEVHHVVPISKMGAGYKINPKKDLVPLCSNCHRMIHRRKDDLLTPSQIRKILGKKPKKL